MLIRRCAWHRSYRGYPIFLGVTAWRDFRVSFTDGMCLGCAARFRRQWNLPEINPRPVPFARGKRLARAAVLVLAVTSLAVAGRQVDDPRTRETVAPPPETVLIPSAPVEEDPTPALAVGDRPGRTRRNVSIVARAEASRVRPRSSVAARSASIAPASWPAIENADPAPAVIPPVPMASPAMESPRGTVFLVAAVPHAGLMHQAP